MMTSTTQVREPRPPRRTFLVKEGTVRWSDGVRWVLWVRDDVWGPVKAWFREGVDPNAPTSSSKEPS